MKRFVLLLLLMMFPLFALGQWGAGFNTGADYSVSGTWNFTGDVAMGDVIIDSLTVIHISDTTAVLDTLWFEDQVTGFYLKSEGVISVCAGSAAPRWEFSGLDLCAKGTTNKFIAGSTKLNDPYFTFRSDNDTGISHPESDQLSGVAGSVQGWLLAAGGFDFIRWSLHTIAAGDTIPGFTFLDAADSTLKVFAFDGSLVSIADLTP